MFPRVAQPKWIRWRRLDVNDERMNFLPTIWRWLRSFGQRRVVKQEIDEELRFHIELRTAENIAAGIGAAETPKGPRRPFGEQQSLGGGMRDVGGGWFCETNLQKRPLGFR